VQNNNPSPGERVRVTKNNDDLPFASTLVLFCRPKLGANENDGREVSVAQIGSKTKCRNK
jgi:hypothetical protein